MKELAHLNMFHLLGQLLNLINKTLVLLLWSLLYPTPLSQLHNQKNAGDHKTSQLSIK